MQLLWESALWTFIGGLLLSVENLNVILSRTGILDIFVTFWIVLGFLLLLLDRRWIEARALEPPAAEEDPEAPTKHRAFEPLWRPWRFTGQNGSYLAAVNASRASRWVGRDGVGRGRRQARGHVGEAGAR